MWSGVACRCRLFWRNCKCSQQSLCHNHNQLPVYRTSHKTVGYSGVTSWFIWCHLYCKTYRVILQWTLNKQDGRARSWLMWLGKMRSGRLLSIWSWIFVLCKLWGISWLAKELLAPLYGCWHPTLCYMYCTTVQRSYHQLISVLPSQFHIIVDKILHTVKCNKNPASLFDTHNRSFLHLILTAQSDLCIVSNQYQSYI